jgi:hypothetical protein
MSRAQTSAPSQSSGMQSYGSQQSGSLQAGQMQIPHDKIAMRAYEKWCRRGRPQGSDQQDWLEAELELRQELSRGSTGSSRR